MPSNDFGSMEKMNKNDIIATFNRPRDILEVFLCHVALKGRPVRMATLRVSVSVEPGRPFSVFSL